jgi:hemerythrin-like domain-containing protein
MERARLLETLAGFDDPLEMLLACHRRIEKQLETLKRLRAHVDANGVDAEATAAAQAVLRYFVKAGANHHQDEEEDLFPMLDRRIVDAGEHARFMHFRERLEADHRQLEGAWQRLRRPLEGIADGFTRTLPAADVQSFVEAYAHHILVEETTLREFIDRWLDDEDRMQLGRAMAARRQRPEAA